MFSRLKNWWNQPCGAKELLIIALPLIISTSSWSIMHFIDRLCLAWHSKEALAACMPAGMTHFTIFCFPQGLAAYCVTFVAQYWGAKRPEQIASVVWQGLYIGFLFLPIIWLTGLAAPWFYNFLGHSADVAAHEAAYYQSLCVCGGACIMSSALTGFFSGRGQTWIVMIVDTLASGLNIVLDLLMIFGTAKISWWFLPQIPELGIVGAGLATSIAVWFKTIVYFAIFWSKRNRETFHTLSNWKYDWSVMRRLLYFGAPSGLQLIVENFSCTSQLLIMGVIGAVEIAGTNLAFNIECLVFMPVLGLGLALTTMVGQCQGKKRPDLSVKATHTALWFGMTYTVAFAILYVTCPRVFFIAHEWGTSEDFAQTEAMAVYLLQFIAALMIFDSLNVLFSSVLRGAGDTAYVLLISVCVCPLPALMNYFGVYWFGMGITYAWIVMSSGFFLISACFFARYKWGSWKSMQVIEPEVMALNDDSVITRKNIG